MRGTRPRAPRRYRGRLLTTLAEIEAARRRIPPQGLGTPLIRLQAPEAPCEIWLKLECLQPIGSFKLRGAGSAIGLATREQLAGGVWTTSAGNMAQGIAWLARELGIPSTIVVPDHAPRAKLDAIERLGGTTIPVAFDRWWETMERGSFPGLDGLFIHPVQDDAVIAGNGTIALELVEQLDAFDAVLVPWGGGGLTTGIASGLRAVRETVRIYPCEPETGAPVAAAIAAGRPVPVSYRASFVDGAGAKALLPGMWERARGLITNSFVVSLDDTAAAIRLLAERAHVVAEGAGALAVAAALSGRAGHGRVVCIVSGGNIDPSRLSAILAGTTPD